MKIIIYKITNSINEKTYIGQHKTRSILKDDGYLGSGKLIKQAVAKYGAENFSKKIITIAMDRLEADTLEKFYIAKERSIGKAEYNIADGGGGTIGVKNPKLSERNKNYCWNKGKRNCYSSETIEKFSNAKKGQVPWNKGKHIGKHWYTNDKEEILAKECPNGWIKGRLPR